MGVFGFSLTNLFIGTFVFQFYVYTVNLNSLLVSIGLSISLIVGAVSSIIWGIVIDNKKPGKYGKRRPYLFFGLPIWVITSILLWLPPWFCPKGNSIFWPTAIYFWVVITIKPIAGTSVLMAHSSMYPEQSQTDENRKKIADVGTVFNIIASMLALILPLAVQSLLADPENVKWWESSGKILILYIPIIGAIFAIFGLIGMTLSFFSVNESFYKNRIDVRNETLSFKLIFQQMHISTSDKNFKNFLAVSILLGIAGRIVGLVIIPFLVYVLKFRGTDYFIYLIISFSCKFGWYFIWKKVLKKQALVKTFSLCILLSALASFLELIFVIQTFHFEFKISLFIISYGTVLGSMYAFGLFTSPLYSDLVYEAASKAKDKDMEDAVSAISGAYVGLSTFMASIGPAIASLIIGFILMGSNQESSIILTMCLSSTGIFYLLSLLYLRKIKLEKTISEIPSLAMKRTQISPV